jgi:uncharacterized membrane protein
MRTNRKYSTLFPLFYLLGSLTHLAGLDAPSQWVPFWLAVFTFCSVAVGWVLFYGLTRRGYPLLGLAAALVWFFNRWTVWLSADLHMDSMPILLMVLSVVLFPQKRWLSLLLFGISLALKHVAIFAAPLYLFCVWRSGGEGRVRKTALAACVLCAVPLGVSLPFMFPHPVAFVKSILFSGTRYATGQPPSFDVHMDWVGLPARIPMLVLVAVTYAAALWEQIGLSGGILLILTIVLGFNSVLFPQYFPYALALVAPAIAEALPPRTGAAKECGEKRPGRLASQQGTV